MNKTVPVALTLASLLTLSGCAGTTSDFECNAKAAGQLYRHARGEYC